MSRKTIIGSIVLLALVLAGFCAWLYPRKPKEEAPYQATIPEIGALEKAQRMLADGDVESVNALARELPDSRAVELIIRATGTTSPDFDSRYREKDGKSVYLGEAITSPRTPPEALVTMLYAHSPSTRSLAISAIIKRKEKMAVPRLVEIASSPVDNGEWSFVIYALAELRDPRAIPALERFAATEGISNDVARLAREALEAMQEKR